MIRPAYDLYSPHIVGGALFTFYESLIFNTFTCDTRAIRSDLCTGTSEIFIKLAIRSQRLLRARCSPCKQVCANTYLTFLGDSVR